jgi:hypothetical protein
MYPSAVPPVLCTGILRSGSTWSFNVCRLLAELEGRRLGLPVTSNFIGDEQLEQLVADGLGRAPGPVVLKAHALGDRAVAAVRSGSVRVVCTLRDPRDCVASDLTFSRLGYEESVRRVHGMLWTMPFYRSSPHALFVRYEEMIANPLRQVTKIAAHMGVDADPLELRRIDATTGLQSARATVAGLRHRRPEEVLWCDGRRVDPTTHLHENHVQAGRVGRWRNDLPPDRQQELTEVFHPWLVELGYEPAREPGSAYA